MSEFSEETASLDFLSEDEVDEEEFWEQETMQSSGDSGCSCDCETTDRYTYRHKNTYISTSSFHLSSYILNFSYAKYYILHNYIAGNIDILIVQ